MAIMIRGKVTESEYVKMWERGERERDTEREREDVKM